MRSGYGVMYICIEMYIICLWYVDYRMMTVNYTVIKIITESCQSNVVIS